MATYLPQQVWGDGPNISDADRDKYFDKEDNGNHDPRYTLKEGYEARSLGKGEQANELNSLATYTNDFDSLHDEYDPKSDRDNYGIFKTYPRPDSTDSAPPTDTTPEPDTSLETPPNKSTVDSSHLAEAKDRVNEWENKSWSGERAEENFDFTDNRFVNSSNQAPEEPTVKANDLLDTYKNNLMGTASAFATQ